MRVIMRNAKLLFSFLFLSALFISNAKATEQLDYPELLVAPRASERLQMEVEREKNWKWFSHLPVQISSFGTLLSAVMFSGKDDSANVIRLGGIAVGAGWIGATALLSAFYTPYQSGIKDTSELPKGSKRDQLVKERVSEGAIDSASTMGTRLTWLSVITNGATSAVLAVLSQGKSMGQFIALGSTVLAFTPVIFRYRWNTVEHEQREYKKKIYGNISQFQVAPVLLDQYALATSHSFKPAMGLNFSFAL